MNRYNGYNAKVDYFEQSYKLLNILPTWLFKNSIGTIKYVSAIIQVRSVKRMNASWIRWVTCVIFCDKHLPCPSSLFFRDKYYKHIFFKDGQILQLTFSLYVEWLCNVLSVKRRKKLLMIHIESNLSILPI